MALRSPWRQRSRAVPPRTPPAGLNISHQGGSRCTQRGLGTRWGGRRSPVQAHLACVYVLTGGRELEHTHQVKNVFESGQQVPDGFGRHLNGLFKAAVTAGKRVRSETKIASGAVSVSSAAAELALMKLPSNNYECVPLSTSLELNREREERSCVAFQALPDSRFTRESACEASPPRGVGCVGLAVAHCCRP